MIDLAVITAVVAREAHPGARQVPLVAPPDHRPTRNRRTAKAREGAGNRMVRTLRVKLKH